MSRWGNLHRGFACPLCYIARDINRLRIDVDTEPFTPQIVTSRGSWSKGAFQDLKQHDVTEAITLLLDDLNSVDEREIIGSVDRFATPMWQILQTQCISRLHCHTCHCSSDHLERLTSFSLEVPERSQHIEVLLANQFGDQPLKEGDDPYRCPSVQSCDNMRANVTKTLIPRQWPQVLILSLKRWRTYMEHGVLQTRKSQPL